MSNNWFDLFGFTEIKIQDETPVALATTARLDTLNAGDIVKFEGQYWEIAHPIGNSMRLESGGHFVYLPKLRVVEVVLRTNNKPKRKH